MNNKVFLSYSWKDCQIAMRLYDDLSRSNVPIWRDQIDGDPTADFEKEFLRKIDECDYFIMLDSPNYREKSTWCYTEVKRCLENIERRNAPRIIVCILVEDGPWRRKHKNERQKQVFEQINKLKYQKLYYSGYDDENVYDKTLNFICELLETSYEKWDKIPTYQDFMDELNILHDETTSKILLDGYKHILNKDINGYPNVKESFLVWLDDCKNAGAPLFFPKWTYAVWLVNQDGSYLKESEKLFYELTESYPEDPRGFRGYGSVSAAIANSYREENNMVRSTAYYKTAIQYLQKAEMLMELPKNRRHKDVCQFDVLTNIGKVFLITGNYAESLQYNNRAIEIMKKKRFFREVLIDDSFFLMKKMGFDTLVIIDWLKRLLLIYGVESLLYQLLGLCYIDTNEGTKARIALSKAYELCPSDENKDYLANAISRFCKNEKETEKPHTS